RARIAQSLALPPIVDEPVSPLRDVNEGEACPNDSGFEADQDRANIAKTSTLPHESTSRVTSLSADEGSMQHKVDELTALCTSLQRQHLEMVARFETKGLEIESLKARIKVLEDKDRGVVEQSKDDASIKGRSGGVQVVPTAAEVSAATVSIPTSSGVVSTASPIIPTAAPIFTTATESTPYTRRKGKETMVESETPKKKKSLDEVPEEKVKEMMQLVLIKEVYIEALQVKHPIIDWKVHTEGHRSYWKITMLGGSSASYQFFVGLLKHLDREDLNQLWALVKESLNIKPASSNKEMELWVELKRLYEPDDEDELWTHTQNMMHAPIEWKLYDSCGVHNVTSKDNEIFTLIEKDYPLRKGLAIVMISYKLQLENYS
nr:hypothetical protein [Tanacetum cinerariifolium]